MKRHALLIGYSGWDIENREPLKGVSLDLYNYKKFLMSFNGGGWYENEITMLQDKSITEIRNAISQCKRELNDIVFTVFSGHGDFDDLENYCRRFEVSKSETILEKEFYGLSRKQILICDCCSGLRSQEIASETKTMTINDRLYSEREDKLRMARKKYEELCLKCPEQSLKFYAAEAGCTADDTARGGRYTVALLDTLNNAPTETNIFQAHNIAARKVQNETNNEQIPDYSVPKIHDFLPGSMAINIRLYS